MRQNSSLLNDGNAPERKVSPSSDNNSLSNSTFYVHINLANNNSNHVTKFGLNVNKRGKMTENDKQRFADSLKCSDRLERHRNRELFKMKNLTKTLMPRINEEQFVQK